MHDRAGLRRAGDTLRENVRGCGEVCQCKSIFASIQPLVEIRSRKVYRGLPVIEKNCTPESAKKEHDFAVRKRQQDYQKLPVPRLRK